MPSFWRVAKHVRFCVFLFASVALAARDEALINSNAHEVTGVAPADVVSDAALQSNSDPTYLAPFYQPVIGRDGASNAASHTTSIEQTSASVLPALQSDAASQQPPQNVLHQAGEAATAPAVAPRAVEPPLIAAPSPKLATASTSAEKDSGAVAPVVAASRDQSAEALAGPRLGTGTTSGDHPERTEGEAVNAAASAPQAANATASASPAATAGALSPVAPPESIQTAPKESSIGTPSQIYGTAKVQAQPNTPGTTTASNSSVSKPGADSGMTGTAVAPTAEIPGASSPTKATPDPVAQAAAQVNSSQQAKSQPPPLEQEQPPSPSQQQRLQPQPQAQEQVQQQPVQQAQPQLQPQQQPQVQPQPAQTQEEQKQKQQQQQPEQQQQQSQKQEEQKQTQQQQQQPEQQQQSQKQAQELAQPKDAQDHLNDWAQAQTDGMVNAWAERRGQLSRVFGVGSGLLVVIYFTFLWRDDTAAKSDSENRQPPEANVSQQDSAGMKSLKSKRMHVIMDQVMGQNRLNKLNEEIENLEISGNTEIAGALTDEALDKKAKKAVRTAELAAQRSASFAFASAAPVVMETQRIYGTISSSLQKAQDTAREAVKSESKKAINDALLSMNLNVSTDDAARMLQNMNPVHTGILTASALAPMQLRSLFFGNQGKLAFNMVFIGISSIVLIWDGGHKHRCEALVFSASSGAVGSYEIGTRHTNIVLDWTLIDCLGLTTFTVVRIFMHRSLRDVVGRLEAPPPVNAADSPQEAFRILADFYMGAGAKALQELDRVSRSRLYSLVNWTVVFSFVLLAWGVYIVFNVPWATCNNMALFVLRIRATIWLTMFVPQLIGVFFFIFQTALESERFSIALLSFAHRLEKIAGVDIPFGRAVVYALMFRSMQSMVDAEIAIKREAQAALESEKQVLDDALLEHTAALAVAEEQRQRLEEEKAQLQDDEAEVRDFDQVMSEALQSSGAYMQQAQDGAEQMRQDAAEHAAEITAQVAREIKESSGTPMVAARSLVMRGDDEKQTIK